MAEVKRSFKLPGQQFVHFKKNPRFGTWSANFDKGGFPPSLAGEWQSFDDLFRKVDFYLQHREKFKCSIGEEVGVYD